MNKYELCYTCGFYDTTHFACTCPMWEVCPVQNGKAVQDAKMCEVGGSK